MLTHLSDAKTHYLVMPDQNIANPLSRYSLALVGCNAVSSIVASARAPNDFETCSAGRSSRKDTHLNRIANHGLNLDEWRAAGVFSLFGEYF